MPGNLTYKVGSLKGGSQKRLEEAILYIAGVCERDDAFAMTRLNKILFEADFYSYRTRGVPITGASYQALQNGPAPRAMLPRLTELQEKSQLRIREVDYQGLTQHRPIALRDADLAVFDAKDIAILDK